MRGKGCIFHQITTINPGHILFDIRYIITSLIFTLSMTETIEDIM